jgi:hypothetical protein
MNIEIIVHEDDFQKVTQVSSIFHSFNIVSRVETFPPLFMIINNYKYRFEYLLGGVMIFTFG